MDENNNTPNSDNNSDVDEPQLEVQYQGTAEQATSEFSLEFRGNTTEFFKIWIVNTLFTILTVGIYSAWAKVRKKKYFYANTFLKGSTFEYHGDPLAILIGRIIVAVFYIAFVVSQQLSPLLTLALTAIGFAVFPWIIVRSLIFNASNSSYRNIRFAFKKNYKDSYITFLGFGFLAAITFGLAVPLMMYRQQMFFGKNTRYGAVFAKYSSTVGALYYIYLIPIITSIVFVVLLMVTIKLAPALGIIMVFGIYGLMLYLAAYVKANLTNNYWNSLSLQDMKFSSTQKAGELFMLYLVNLLGIIISLGLLAPWAHIRIAQYRAKKLTVLASTDQFENFVQGETQHASGIGEASADFWDIDLGIW